MTLEEAIAFFQNLVNLMYQNGQVAATPAQFVQLNEAWTLVQSAAQPAAPTDGIAQLNKK